MRPQILTYCVGFNTDRALMKANESRYCFWPPSGKLHWCTGDAPKNNNWIQAENWGGEDDALLISNDDPPALGSIPGTHQDPSWWNMLQENCSCVWIWPGAYDFSLLNEPELGTKENQLQPIFMYSSCLETNKEQLNAGWEHLPVLYFIHTHKKVDKYCAQHMSCQ